MSGLRKTAGLAAIVLSLSVAGCGSTNSNDALALKEQQEQQRLGRENAMMAAQQPPRDYNSNKSLYEVHSVDFQGKIVDVQGSSVPFQSSGGTATYGGNHDFEYVIFEPKGNDATTLTLIYPYSRAIMKGDAKITFYPLESGGISVPDFRELFVKDTREPQSPSVFFKLLADGIVKPNGITYITEKNK